MTVQKLVVQGQKAAEKLLLVDRCSIRRRNYDLDVTDPDTGVVTPGYDTLYTNVPCRVKRMTTTLSVNPARDRMIFEQHLTVLKLLFQLPVYVTGILNEDEIIMLDSIDTDLIGRTLRVDGLYGQTHSTMRRYIVEEMG